jgi:hypothetical protein
MSAIDCALIHYPVRDRAGGVVTTAVTNLDVHDIARSARTYGLGRYYVVTPIEAQHQLVKRVTEHWTHGAGRRRMPERHEALELCHPVASLEQAVADAELRHGRRPQLIATAARSGPRARLSFDAARALFAAARAQPAESSPLLILFGTGHGLADIVLESADHVLAPIPGLDGYNHLSVRAAAAIIFDRLLGAR